jgi:hypothetical protein
MMYNIPAYPCPMDFALGRETRNERKDTNASRVPFGRSRFLTAVEQAR